MIQNKTFRDKGLPARFLFANCTSMVGSRTFDKPEVSAAAIEAYNELIRKLLEGVFDRSRSAELTELTLTPEGFTAYVEFSQGVESRLGNNGELKFMQDWCAKLPGQMLRIAGIIAVCDGVQQINADVIKRAATIADWFLANAITVFGEGIAVSEEFSASKLTQFLEECTISEKGSSVKTAELLKLYNEWATEYGYEPALPQNFVGELKNKLTVVRSKKGNVAKNLRIKT